jgi:uncharacterized membrane protein
MRVEVVATILGMALITYTTRAGGLWLMGRIQPTPRLERWLQSLPGAILAALVAPAALAAGPAEALATVLTALIAARTGNLLAALGGGVISVYVLRQVM